MSTFEQFVEEHGTALLRFTRVLTGDHHGGQDLAQSTLATAYLRWTRVEAADDPWAYLRKIAVNTHIDAGRRRSTGERPWIADDLAGAVGRGPRGGGAAPGADVAMLEREALRVLVDSLPSRARAVLVLRYYADLDDEAIASAMGISASTVRATASRSLATLRRDLPAHEARAPER